MADETRRMPPFGSPRGTGRHDLASKRSTGGVASSQTDPPQGGTGARAQRHGRWRDRSPLRLPECMDGPAPLAFARPAGAPREVRLNGFPEALAEVLRHRVGGGRRVPGAVPTAVFGASKVVQPAYPLWVQRAGEGHAPSIPEKTRADARRGDPFVLTARTPVLSSESIPFWHGDSQAQASRSWRSPLCYGR